MMTVRIAHSAAYVVSRSPLAARLGRLLSEALAASRPWLRRRHDRHALLRLDDHMLRDIGFGRARAHEMASRPFWRA